MKEDLRVRRTYKLLAQALLELIEEKKFEKISVVEICERAMVHRATFYAHFHDKYDLLGYCVSSIEMPFEQTDITEHTIDGYKKYYYSVATAIINRLNDKSDIVKKIIKQNEQDSLFDNLEADFAEIIKDKLDKIVDNGININAPTDLLAQFFSSASVGILKWWIKSEKKIPMEDIINYLSVLITGMIW